jgi:hypothetical protein
MNVTPEQISGPFRLSEGAMSRTLEELYAQIARLPAAQRLRLAARILNDLAAQTGSAAEDRTPAPSRNGKPPAAADGRPAPVREADARPATPPPPAPTRFLIVDGSNLLGRLPGFALNSPASRDTLALRLQEYAHTHPNTRVTLYFDGEKASTTRRGGIEIRYSPKSQPADYFMLQYLERLPADERTRARLVTADHELADAARLLGVAIETPESVQRQILGPPRAPSDRGLTKTEVAEWEEYFRRPPEKR